MRSTLSPGRGFGSSRRRGLFGFGLAFGLLAVIIVVMMIVALFFGARSVFGSTHTVTFKVVDRQRVCSRSSGGGCQYLIWTDKGVFKDTDSLLHWKFRSSDLYGQLTPGKRFTCKVYGIRSGLVSEYPNITSCTAA